MKVEQFELIVMVGVRRSLAVKECDSDFVLNDILGEDLCGRVDVNPDWEDYERLSIEWCEEYGTYKVTGTVTISEDREHWDYDTTWEKIA